MLELCTLGSPGIHDSRDGLLTPSPKPLALLVYLALARPRGPQQRDTLLALFYPDLDHEHARLALRQLVHALRAVVGAAAVRTDRQTVAIEAGTLTCDVLAFEAALAAGDHAKAVAAYGGPFLSGFFLSGCPEFEQWVESERSRLQRAYERALEQVALATDAAGDALEAVRLWSRLAEADPYATRVAVRLMAALEVAGERAAALEVATQHAARLKAELGAEPSPEIEALARRLRAQPAPRTPQPGGSTRERLAAAVAGRYRVIGVAGAGAMALVYRAEDLKLGRSVALKVLRPELVEALGQERFLNEVDIAAGLAHPNILPLHDVGAADGLLYYVMPYVEGESLRARLAREGPLGVGEAARIAREVAEALAYAHGRGIVHRDIKPANILLLADHAVVSDFGVARAIGAIVEDPAFMAATGTPAYMSPEQGAEREALDGRSDLYSLGCVLYEMLSGETPFPGHSTRSILSSKLYERAPRITVRRRDVPLSVDAALVKVLARDPADRFATAAQFAAALAQPTPVHRAGRRRRTLAVGLVAAVGVTMIGGGALLFARRAATAVTPEVSLIAVAPFAPADRDTALARLGRDLVVTLSANLQDVGEIRTVDALSVLSQAARPEVRYSRQQAVDMARRLGAGRLIHGSLVRLGPDVRLYFGLFTSDSLTVLARGAVTAPAGDVTALTDSATWSLLRQLWRIRAPPTPSLAAITTTSIPALRAFLDGEQAVSQNRWADGEAAFLRAIEADSTFWLAYERYHHATYWQKKEAALPAYRIYWEHLDDLPKQDAECARAANPYWTARDAGDPPPPSSTSWHFKYLSAAAERYPDCLAVLWNHADDLTHFGPRVGYSVVDAQAALEQILQRLPQLGPFWDHLLWMTQGRDSVAVGRALEALARLEEPANGLRSVDRLMDRAYRTGKLDSLLADTAARAVRADEFPSVGFVVTEGFPREAIAVGRRALAWGLPRPAGEVLERELAFAWAARGAWDSALVTLDRLVSNAAHEAGLDAYRLSTAGAWLGALPPEAARSRRDAALDALQTARAGDSAEVWWLDGVLAATEGDVHNLARARETLERMDDTTTGLTVPSLRALQMELAGDAPAAGRLLAEAEWRDTDPFRGGYEGHPFVRSVNRLAAARWLLVGGDTVQAVRLLVWHELCCEWWRSLAGATYAPVAYLELGRIEEARGHAAVAGRHYEQVLRRYDLPVPALRRVVMEAEAARERMRTSEGVSRR